MTRMFCNALLILMLLVSGPLVAQPKIVLNMTRIDVGTIYQGDIKKIDLVVSNAGNQPLVVSRIETSCGCTSAKKSVPTLLPGGSDTIIVTFNSAGFSGKVTKTVTIQSNDPSKRYIDATITGTVTSELEVVPAMTVLNFGSSPVGTTGIASFVFRNASPEPVTFRGMTSADTTVTAHIGLRTVQPADTITVSFSYTPHAARLVDNYLYLETGSPRQPKVPFRFFFIGTK